ncbi:hypothetical protein ACFLU6_11015 [Acidobacteriota bacterium]
MKASNLACWSTLLLLLLPMPSWSDCDTPHVCSDVSTSLKGSIVGSNVVIEWDTDSEGTDLGHYEIYRFDCANPQCLVYVDSVSPTGTCNQNEPYLVEDTPPSPVSSWTYQVRVIKKTGSTQCSINVEPE